MVSRALTRILATLACIAALGAVPRAGVSQSAERLHADEERERIAEQIAAAETQNGRESAALIVPLIELGALYEREGQHALAIAALEQARQIVRRNYGLNTLNQAPLIERELRSQQALGNFAAARALEQELFDLAERYPDDLRTVAIHRNIGARRMRLLERFLAGERPREVYDGLYAFTNHSVVTKLASEAQVHYADAAAVILRNRLYSSDELRELETDIVRASDVFRRVSRGSQGPGSTFSERETLQIPDTPRDAYGVGHDLQQPNNYTLQALRKGAAALWDLTPSGASESADARRRRTDNISDRYEVGRESYRRLIAYDEAAYGSWPGDESAWERRLDAHLQLADWDLLYHKNGAALDEYELAYEMLDDTGRAESLRAKLFAPAIPITVPTFLPNPLQTPATARYVDVAFEITRYGESRRVEIRDGAPNVSSDEKRELVSLVKNSRFRPRMKDGQFAASSVALRYYLPE